MGRKNILEGVLLLQNVPGSDNRGSTVKFYKSKKTDFKVSESMIINSKKGVIRGIHFQKQHAQRKMITCIRGRIYVVVVDIRPDSAEFGNWMSLELDGTGEASLIIPQGFALGTYAMEDSMINYMCEGEYYPGFDDGIKWDDKSLKVAWPIDSEGDEPIISEKDSKLSSFEEYRKEMYER
ncbi:MAG: dTDP-4-dehydrorhamnose 3,5-epimerase family protein [Agathobacter sp.]|nr:dTDP-4-dehydrorhamnose 3,5-epimerase family protein [Agathobacter sp.]